MSDEIKQELINWLEREKMRFDSEYSYLLSIDKDFLAGMALGRKHMCDDILKYLKEK